MLELTRKMRALDRLIDKAKDRQELTRLRDERYELLLAHRAHANALRRAAYADRENRLTDRIAKETNPDEKEYLMLQRYKLRRSRERRLANGARQDSRCQESGMLAARTAKAGAGAKRLSEPPCRPTFGQAPADRYQSISALPTAFMTGALPRSPIRSLRAEARFGR